jgi:hypothetical protein
MLTRDRLIRIRFSADSVSPRLRTRVGRRRASEAKNLTRAHARVRLVDDDPFFEDSRPRESSSQASYAGRLYAASAT